MVYKSLKITRIKGKIFSGRGEGAKFIELPWAKKQITEKLGFVPYPGTLNMKISDKSLNLRNLLGRIRWTEILPVDDFCSGRLAKAYFIENLKCAIVIPEVENYPENVIELIAPINLRKRFKLRDGNTVEVKIPLLEFTSFCLPKNLANSRSNTCFSSDKAHT